MLPEWYNIYKQKVETSIQEYLQKYLEDYKNPTQAIRDFQETLAYSMMWGKRLRAILAIEFYLTLTGKKIEDITLKDDILKYAIALEVIHSFSLIHDDLPCMDNDEYRRGQLTVWKKYGEYQAVLAGDTLNTLAFEIISSFSDAQACQKVTKILASSVWIYGMAWGQIEDLFYERTKEEVTEEILKGLHFKKTGQVIIASILWALVIAKREDLCEKYQSFWEKLWLAFQIKDDILDVEGSFEETGKSVWWEVKGFVYILWLEKSKNQLDTLIKDCINDVASLQSEKLDFIVHYVQHRTK